MSRRDFSRHEVGPYLLTHLIGAGSDGSVYHAVDTYSGESNRPHYPRAFAIKCLSRDKISRQHGARLVAEILYLEATAGCPNVLTLHDIIDKDLCLFLIFDLCDTDMCYAIKNGVYWKNDDRIKQAFTQVLDAVDACHERTIFHRDLKPDNIMCNLDGTGVRVGDFGWATHYPVSLDGGCGTPNYMSPESWVSHEGDPYYSAPVDVWSLGVILFTMVTNRNPWGVALPSDKEFKAFIDDEDYLFHTSPISERLSALLKWIMHPIPTMRLPIPVIRQIVLKMDTFYKNYSLSDASSLPASREAAFTESEPTRVENPLNGHAGVSSCVPKY